MSDSTEAGYLSPLAPPLDDDELVDLLQPVVAAVGGWADTSKVRPRWQPVATPNQPQFEEDWCALGIAQLQSDSFKYTEQSAAGDVEVLAYSEQFDVLVSCYGPRASRYARNLSDGLHLDQNRAALQALKIDVLYVGNFVVVPALQAGRWLRRVDVAITMRRWIEQSYAVRSITGIVGGLDNEHYITPIVVKP